MEATETTSVAFQGTGNLSKGAASSVSRAIRRPSCRFCGAALEVTFADLGSTPLCESFIAPERLCRPPPLRKEKFPEMVLFCTVTKTPRLYTPPPKSAVFPERVLYCKITVPERLYRPPPKSAEFPVRVLLRTVRFSLL